MGEYSKRIFAEQYGNVTLPKEIKDQIDELLDEEFVDWEAIREIIRDYSNPS
jgi:hypothetical protein